jgi:hypothetical protein
METQNIYLVFSKTGTWLSNSIGLITGSPYAHVSLSLDTNFNKMYTFGRLHPDTPFTGGLTIENLYTGVYTNRDCKCLIYKVPVSNEQLALLSTQLFAYYSSDIHYKYNFIGLFGVLLDKPVKRNTHYFCSQFVSKLLIESGIYETSKPPELISPTDLMLIPNKEVIFEGLLNEFTKSSPSVAILPS